MKAILDELLEMQDREYGDFQAKLLPTIDRATIIGVRIPDLRRLAKRLRGEPASEAFMAELPHGRYEENCLHALLINEKAATVEEAAAMLDTFLPYVDNWATCDTISIKPFGKHPREAYPLIMRWLHSDKTFTIRYAVDALMEHYLGDAFDIRMLDEVSALRSDEYYVNMARAWLFAEALAKRPDDAIGFFTDRRLDVWTHNKALQKARESRRIDDEGKARLQTLKIKLKR